MRVLAFLLLPVAAQAETLADTHFTMNFCYEQRFGMSDRAEQPERRVRSIGLGRERSGHMHALGTTPVQVRVTFFGDDREYRAMADCTPDQEVLACRMEDGGFRVEAEGGNAVRLLVGEGGMAFHSEWSEGHRLRSDEEADRDFVLSRCG